MIIDVFNSVKYVQKQLYNGHLAPSELELEVMRIFPSSQSE